MKAVLIAMTTLLAVPAMAQGGGDVQPPQFRSGNGSNGSWGNGNGNPGNGNPGNGNGSWGNGNSGNGNGSWGNGNGNSGYGNPGTPGTPAPQDNTLVVMDRDALMKQLASINEKLNTASIKAKKDRQLQKGIDDARAELKEVARQVSSAPLARSEPQRPTPPPAPQPQVQPITEAMLRSLTTSIRNEPFADDQLAVLQEAAPSQYFLVAQTQQLLRLFNFSRDRLKAMRVLRPRLLDMENSYKLYDSFEFSNDKEELKRILAAQ